jgi:hypothetical protein
LDRTTDLGRRWQRARRAARAAEVPEPSCSPSDVDDAAILIAAPAAAAAAAQRGVFDNSRRLGDGFRRFHGAELTLAELPMVLAQLAAASATCLRGTWTQAPDEDTLLLERTGCPAGAGGPRSCDWWREAISGLVLGVTGGLRHARHCSVGHGADRCIDVFHVDPQSPRRYGPIPDDMRAQLAAVARSVAILDASCTVEFLGLSDDVLYYRLPTADCGGSVRGQPLVERSVRRRFPRVSLCEVTPRPVLAES